MTSKATCIAWTNGAIVRAVAGFTAFVAYRGFRSRAVVSVVALRFERALAIGALVFRTREAQSSFVSRAAAFAAWFEYIRMLNVLMFRTCCTHGICTLLASVDALVLRIGCSIWRTRRGRFGVIENHS